MTKVTILGEEPQETKKKPIQALVCLQSTGNFNADNWLSFGEYDLRREELKIIKVKGYENFDCVIVDENSNVFLGFFNDGVVE